MNLFSLKIYQMKLYKKLLLLAIIGLAGCHSENKKGAETNTGGLPVVLVSEPVVRGFQHAITLPGIAMANQEVKVYAMCDGYVKMWKYDIGDMVKRGATLAELSNPELLEQQVKAKAELDGATAIYNRLESVYKKSPELVPLQQVDEAKAKYESSSAALDVINAQIEYLTIKAPFNGIITNRYIDTGAVVQNGLDRPNTEPLFTIQDIATIRLNVSIPEINCPNITKGALVNITFRDLPSLVLNEKVSRISYGLSEENKTMLAQIDIENKNHTIHPGMFANVSFAIASNDSSLSVPNNAIGSYEQQSFVYIVNPVDSASSTINWENGIKCIVKKIIVQPGTETSDYCEIKGAGLKPTDKIVISGNAQCSDGSPVIAKKNK